MSILVNKETRVVVQGITGRSGRFNAQQSVAYGTKIVAGTSPGKGGGEVDGIPIYNTVAEAVRMTGADASTIYVPAPFAPDAIMETADAGIGLVVCITEGVSVLDMVKVKRYLEGKPDPSDWPKLSGRHHARRMQNRGAARFCFSARQDRHRFPQRNVDVRSGVSTDEARSWTIHLRRHWR